MRTLYDTVLKSSIDLQYESILDAEDEILDKVDKSAIPILGDQHHVNGVRISNGSWSEIDLSRYFDWRAVLSYCKKHKYNPSTRYRWKNEHMGELIAIIENVPLLGCEQNVLSVLRMFLKKGYNVGLSSVDLDDRIGLKYYINKPGSDDPQDRLKFEIFLTKH